MSAQLYRTIGGAAGCHALAEAFYARVERDPVLRPLFPSTFTCAIEEFSAFLVQFLGGESDETQRRWRLSLGESHSRFAIGRRERDAWLRAMALTLSDESTIADAAARGELLEFFTHASTHVMNQGPAPKPAPLDGELAPLWDEQLALDQAVALMHSPESAEQCLALLQSPALQSRFARSPAVHASVIALAAGSKIPRLREYAISEIHANRSLVHERYKGWRSLLHDAVAGGDISLVEQLFDLGAGDLEGGKGRPLLYCVGNECSAPTGGQIVQLLLQRGARVNAIYGVKRCTALHMAARRGNVDVVGALLAGGADTEVRDSVGDTPLRRAVNCNRVEAARLLLSRGADPNSKGSRALTPAGAARSSEMKELF